MAIAYGIETTEDDPYIATAEHAMEAVNASLVPGAFLVDLFPICEFRFTRRFPLLAVECYGKLVKYVPEWFPGATFKTKARIWRQSVLGSLNVPWAAVRERMVCHRYNFLHRRILIVRERLRNLLAGLTLSQGL